MPKNASVDITYANQKRYCVFLATLVFEAQVALYDEVIRLLLPGHVSIQGR